MNWPDFSDAKVQFVVVCFLQVDELEQVRQDLERFGAQRNVKLVVQPSPYEAIEFLFRIDADLLSHLSAMNEYLFCKALRLKRETPKSVVDSISERYHAYFCAIVEQDEAAVRRESTALQAFKPHFAPPPAVEDDEDNGDDSAHADDDGVADDAQDDVDAESDEE